jgi:trimeric autotransporter adhesin
MKNALLLLLLLLTFTASKALTVGATTVDVLCNAGADGSATITASAGTPAYTYSLNGATAVGSNLFFGLMAGSYTIVVTDATTATASTVFTISEPSAPIFSTSATGVVSCCTQELIVSASGGTSPFVYSEDGGTNYFSTGSVVAGNIITCMPGYTTIYGKDANNCVSSFNIYGGGPGMTNVMATYTTSNVTTTGGTDGKIENLDPGFGPMSFEAYNSLSPTTLLTSTLGTGGMVSFENLTAGTYIVKRGNMTTPIPGTTSFLPCAIPTVIVITEPAAPLLPTARYSFNYGDARDEVGTNNGAVYAATLTTDRFGNSNHAYEFKISNTSKIIIPNNPAINFSATESFSIAYWTKIATGNVDGYVLSKLSPGSVNGYLFGINSTNTNYCNGTGSYTFFTSSAPMQDVCADGLIGNDITNWQFIVGTHNATTNTSRMYVNGILQTDVGSSTGNTSNIFDLYIGATSPSASTMEKGYINGKVDDISIYKGVLTAAEINDLYTAPNPVPMTMQDNIAINTITISPNPAHDIIALSKPATVIVTDITGKKIIEKNNATAINISSLRNGLYIIQLFSAQGTLLQTNKIIKE